MTTKEKLLELLNVDLAWEYAATIQYVQHAAVITGPEYGDIQKELAIHANEELQHAIILAEQIDYLGGTPTVKTYESLISKEGKEMLEQDLKGEQDAIKRYKERIQQAMELKEFGLVQVLQQILSDEEEHERDLLNALGK